MAGLDLAQFLADGAAGRPDSLTGLSPDFQSALVNLFSNAPPDIQSGLQIKSGYRSPELQQTLWDEALAKYGSPEVARKWVAPPGKSQHNHGMAVDLGYLSPAAEQWAHGNAEQFGLAFPLSNENWHIELANARGGGPGPAASTPGPMGTAVSPPTVPAPLLGPIGSAVSGGPDQMMGNLASMFLQGQQQKLAQRQQEQANEEARRQALFSGPSVFG